MYEWHCCPFSYCLWTIVALCIIVLDLRILFLGRSGILYISLDGPWPPEGLAFPIQLFTLELQMVTAMLIYENETLYAH
jgi:hypothetical protein